MKHIFVFLLLVQGMALWAQTVVSPTDITEKDHLFVLRSSGTPFTGLAIATSVTGKKQMETPYVNGLQNGEETIWYGDGKVMSRIMYADGKFEGPYKTFFPNGNPEVEKIYRGGLMNGPAKHFYEQGGVESEGNYENCRETGTWIFYYPDGKKMKQGNYKEGFEEGGWHFWDENGELVKETVYSSGETVSEKLLKNIAFTKVWEVSEGMSVPESVLYSADDNAIYVSNINGKPSQKDGNGYISKLSLDGKIINTYWVTALDAPKGMVISKKHLFVTNITEIVEIDRITAKILKRYLVKNAKFLNDLACDEAGRIYCTDSQNGMVYLLEKGKVSPLLTGQGYENANGLYYEKGNLYIGTKNTIVKMNVKTRQVVTEVKNTASADGLYRNAEGKFVFSDWAGSVYLAAPGENPVVLNNTSAQQVNAADFGVVSAKHYILIPTFFDNKVVCYSTPDIN